MVSATARTSWAMALVSVFAFSVEKTLLDEGAAAGAGEFVAVFGGVGAAAAGGLETAGAGDAAGGAG